MKKPIALITGMALLTMLLTSCGSAVRQDDKGNSIDSTTHEESDISETENNDMTDTAEPDATEFTTVIEADTEANTEANTEVYTTVVENNTQATPPQTSSNVFLNETNNYYNQDSMTINPRYVYWDNGVLHAECFVINGFSHNVFNISVNNLQISNANGIIASASFGNLNGLSLAPYTNVIWTFEFPASCVANSGADLSQLIVNADVSNNY